MSDKNPSENEDLLWKMHMQMLTRRKKNMEIARIIDDALYDYYSEQGRPVPLWKKEKYDWWIEYLKSLGMDPNNP
jgi:hypothetical protein